MIEDAYASKQIANSRDQSRDARGRWRKGHCPNPEGRPRKKKAENYDPSDLRHFANTQIELMINGQPQKLDRRAALLNKIFESAMKGRVSQQRYLMSLFEKNDDQLFELRQQYNLFVHEWIIDNPNFVSLENSLTRLQLNILRSIAATLNHYHSGQYTAFLDCEVESDDTAGSE